MAVKSKSYLNNPALQFISSALVEEAVEDVAVPKAGQTRVSEAQSASKAVVPLPEPPAQQPPQDPMKPLYVEVRSKRFNALLQPSLYRSLRTLAVREDVSVNELMHRILEAYVAAHPAD